MTDKLKVTILNKNYLPESRIRTFIQDYGPITIKLDDEQKLIISYVNDLERDQQKNLQNTDQKTINKYWEIAAKEFKRELFMNTIRPILKKAKLMKVLTY